MSNDKNRILFVCLGNICRSPAAEGVMKAVVESHDDLSWHIDSAGTARYHIGELPDHRMRRAASARGYDLNHHCRQVCDADFDDYDMIIGMDASNVSNLRRMAPSPEALNKIYSIGRWLDPKGGYDHVPDPYYEGKEGFELVLDQLEYACRNIYNQLTKS